MPRSTGARVCYVKWHRTVHTVGPSHPRTAAIDQKQTGIHENNLQADPRSFTHVIFKGQLTSKQRETTTEMQRETR